MIQLKELNLFYELNDQVEKRNPDYRASEAINSNLNNFKYC